MIKRQTLAIALLATAAALAHAEDAAQKDPKTGKNCVTFFSSEQADNGLVRMNFRNTCATPFQIRIQAVGSTRGKAIEAGSSESPSKAYVSCKADDRCESADWQVEARTP